MSHEATLKLSTNKPEIVYQALQPDTRTTQKNVRVTLEKAEDHIVVHIRAPSLAVLRGVVNTYLRLYRTAQEFARDDKK